MRKKTARTKEYGCVSSSSDNDMYTDACSPITRKQLEEYSVLLHLVLPDEFFSSYEAPPDPADWEDKGSRRTVVIVYCPEQETWFAFDRIAVSNVVTVEEIVNRKSSLRPKRVTEAMLRQGWLSEHEMQVKPWTSASGNWFISDEDIGSLDAATQQRLVDRFAGYRITFCVAKEFYLVDNRHESFYRSGGTKLNPEYTWSDCDGSDLSGWTAVTVRKANEQEMIRIICLVAEIGLSDFQVYQ